MKPTTTTTTTTLMNGKPHRYEEVYYCIQNSNEHPQIVHLIIHTRADNQTLKVIPEQHLVFNNASGGNVKKNNKNMHIFLRSRSTISFCPTSIYTSCI